MRFYYVFPTEKGYWLVAREDETGLMFQTKERALEYVRSVAEAHRPSAVVELSAQGDEVSRQDYP